MTGAETFFSSAERASKVRRAQPEPFFSLLSGVAVLSFAVNNLLLKDTYPNALTGKLSDFAACFFLPLYLAALLTWVVDRPLAWRLRWGARATLVGFAAVKTLPLASTVLNELVAGLTRWSGLVLRPNLVDPTDLIALVMVPLALAYARSHTRIWHEKNALG